MEGLEDTSIPKAMWAGGEAKNQRWGRGHTYYITEHISAHAWQVSKENKIKADTKGPVICRSPKTQNSEHKGHVVHIPHTQEAEAGHD